MGLVLSTKGPQTTAFLFLPGDNKEGIIYDPGNGLLQTRNWLCTLILDLLSSQTVRNKFIILPNCEK
jgi:hypothetical protein